MLPFSVANSFIDSAVYLTNYLSNIGSDEVYESGPNKGKKKTTVMLGRAATASMPWSQIFTRLPLTNLTNMAKIAKL